jgi:hypothetical protein
LQVSAWAHHHRPANWGGLDGRLDRLKACARARAIRRVRHTVRRHVQMPRAPRFTGSGGHNAHQASRSEHGSSRPAHNDTKCSWSHPGIPLVDPIPPRGRCALFRQGQSDRGPSESQGCQHLRHPVVLVPHFYRHPNLSRCTLTLVAAVSESGRNRSCRALGIFRPWESEDYFESGQRARVRELPKSLHVPCCWQLDRECVSRAHRADPYLTVRVNLVRRCCLSSWQDRRGRRGPMSALP